MKKAEKKYIGLAVLMCIFLIGMLGLIEQKDGIHLLGAFFFCMICSGVLLFSLMKLNVMEFRQGTVWYRINACVNRKEDMSGTVKVDYPVVDASRSFRSHTSYKHAA